ncbi:MAG: DNA-3-methyladenine glycosylase [Bacteroidales bacterium]|jgi:DNA-3-methyladenine glycosylase|nr:DNA-3-methyladenine glycosylase [Bacteroidales bacterium]
MTSGHKICRSFYTRDVLEVAPDLLGKDIVLRLDNGTFIRHQVTDVEAYSGSEDKACHASKGKTRRTSVMFEEGGLLYMYLIYGMYWMMNIVTGDRDNPQAALIRGVADISGPGRLTRALSIDGSFNGEDLTVSDRIWLEYTEQKPCFKTGPRIGIDYAGDYWKSVPWRYYVG